MALEAWALRLSLAATPAEVERMKKVIEDFDADAQQLERERGHRAPCRKAAVMSPPQPRQPFRT